MGKSTQADLLAKELARRGLAVEQTREPGGTPGAEAIRGLLLSPPGEGWEAPAEALLFAAARADHVAKRIGPALAAGSWVVCDRFVDSSRAYQGVAGMLGDACVRQLHQIGSGGVLPDLTLVIDAPADQARARLHRRDGNASDAIGGRASDYHARVNAAFREFARSEPERFALVDGSGTPLEVHGRVMAALTPLLMADR